MSKFIGRQTELKTLLSFSQKKSASFIVIRGRRRIGKSRLIEEFGNSFTSFYSFIGLAPNEHSTQESQLVEFSRQIAQQFKTAPARFDNWSDALWALGEKVKNGKILLAFDEISWMGSTDPMFLSYIKNFWDQHLKKNDQLVFIVCGSASSWIEKNILSHTGFVGRISYTLTLEELTLPECKSFWDKNVSAYEKFKVLSVTGGVPKYLEEINPKLPAEENIKKLCFTKGGLLVEEFNQIFSDLFLRNSDVYKKIVTVLINGSLERQEICDILNIDPGGRISEYLEELELAGFIIRDYAWSIKTGVDSKLSKYRLKDNYLRFYLKYIDKQLSKINRQNYHISSFMSLPELQIILALQFENLVLNNRHLIFKELEINEQDVVANNPYYQHKTARNKGCQIDYLIQTKFSTFYVCEIKFSKNPITTSVISEMKQKIDAFVYPKSYSCRPVLIHVNGVTDELREQDYFSAIIDMSKWLV